MAISSVCYRWRTLAFSSPSLWVNLRVEMCPPVRDKVTSLVGFIGTVARYLERSGDWPLKLTLYIQGVLDETERPSLIYLTQHARRWKNFAYCGLYSLTYHMILSEVHFPLLADV
jgi:hypothetical protein